ncbi:MAG: NAD(+)/NADH kinase [Opitutaceae bacterium]|jgi:NAD+ kinase
MPPIRKLAFVINANKAGAPDIGQDLLDLARREGVETKSSTEFPLPPGFLHGCDACCAIGGDGTLLGLASEAAREQVPVIGVNRGSLGFLTTLSAEEARTQFKELLSGKYRIAHRRLLECCTHEGPKELALNDIVVKDEGSSRLVRLEVHAGEELITEYVCDGIIFSTPTGSTAYNLSAGGPLIHPEADVIAMTPICPHTLSNRSIILRSDVCLRVTSHTGNGRLLVALDGQRSRFAGQDSPIRISTSSLRLPLIQRCDYSHFSVVRTKLGWSGGFSG